MERIPENMINFVSELSFLKSAELVLFLNLTNNKINGKIIAGTQ